MGQQNGIRLRLVKGAQKNILPESDDTKPRVQMQMRNTEKQCAGLSAKCIILNCNSDTKFNTNFSKHCQDFREAFSRLLPSINPSANSQNNELEG
jgi:hypothetical protein